MHSPTKMVLAGRRCGCVFEPRCLLQRLSNLCHCTVHRVETLLLTIGCGARRCTALQRGFRGPNEAAAVRGVQGGQVRLVAACIQVCCCSLYHCSADNARPGRYCSPECQKAAWKRGGTVRHAGTFNRQQARSLHNVRWCVCFCVFSAYFCQSPLLFCVALSTKNEYKSPPGMHAM